MKAASFGHFGRNWSATWRSMALAWARSGCRKAWRSAAAHHALLGLGDIGEGIAHPMHAAALPGGAEHPADRRFQPLMGIRDHQLDPAQAASRQALQKARPEGFGLRRADVQPNDLASAIGVDRHSDYRGDRDDAAALALLQVGGIEPQIRPLACERPVEEGMHALVDLLAQLRNLRLADPR